MNSSPLLTQPSPTHGWTQSMSISGVVPAAFCVHRTTFTDHLNVVVRDSRKTMRDNEALDVFYVK